MSYNNLLVLIVLDGWGIAPPSEYNAIERAKKPFFDSLRADYPYTKLRADGEWVGLPRGEVGSSETGHLAIGAGRAVIQDYSRINTALGDGSFYKNQTLTGAFLEAKNTNSNIHLMGLGGMGGVHSSRFHLYALLELGRRLGIPKSKIRLHIFSDGRDSDPKSGLEFIRELQEVITQKGVGKISTLIGRYWAMDRDRRWERTEKAYNTLVGNNIKSTDTVEKAFQDSYKKQVTDEFIEPVVIRGSEEDLIKNGDTVIHFNFRTDRARQLAKAFALDDFVKFRREKFLDKLHFFTLIEFEKNLPVAGIAFRPFLVKKTLGEILSQHQIKQARVAETEKYAFVTYYFNGLCENCIETEEDFLIPSPKVATYDLKPEMSAFKIANKVTEIIQGGKHKFILVNFANPDMVAHTGKTEPTIRAIESVDRCLSQIVPQVLGKGGICVITADHGNAENTSDTKHNPNLVPFIAAGKSFGDETSGRTIEQIGSLPDIAPTVLKLMGIKKPQEMTGKSLL